MKVGNTTKEANAQNGSWRHNILKNVTVAEDEHQSIKLHVDESMKLLPQKSARSKCALLQQTHNDAHGTFKSN